MTFDDIPAGTALFVDANPFIYALGPSPHPQYGAVCQRLLERIDNKEIQGFTSAQAVAEISHRVMTMEAADHFGRTLAGMANWLRRHPHEIQKLTRFRQAIDELAAMAIQIFPVHSADVSRAADICLHHGLLTNDALVVVVMQANGLTHLASLDPDFDRVPGLTRYAPA